MEDFTGSFGDFIWMGITHIGDFEGYDHMLFLAALCAIYGVKSWKTVAALATAFTVGHSITLILGGMSLLSFSSEWIEFLIPVTILLTAIANLVMAAQGSFWLRFMMCVGFGIIHGMGFSSFVRMFAGGDNLVSSLFGFNLGVELGQLAIVAAVLGLNWLVVTKANVPQNWWMRIWSIGAGLIALMLIIQKWPLG
ncbi:MAG: HupE/UreJ family protein [Flavobacteriales bacterium]|nr:HupE/UreJ family protein [Flavobacteriales bacterium]